MLKIIIAGCNGRMGKTVNRLCDEDKNCKVVAGFDINTEANGAFPIYSEACEYAGEADVIIDFSHPSTLNSLLDYAKERKIPIVLCTTGHSEEQLEKIRNTSEHVPIFKSANMSLGINLITGLVRRAAAVLGENFDIEIVEKHHNRKVDAPSGTALMLADAAASVMPDNPKYVYERASVREPRSKNEIGISSVRGGTIVGEHEVIFAGLDEVIEIKHTAYSREVFASGAVRAAKYIATVSQPGLYDMSNMLEDLYD